jgi:hypothetical protein
MMISSLIFAALAASAAPTHEKSETVQNRSFYAIGWPCDGRGCQSNPREFGPNLIFKVPPSNAGFDRAKKLDQSWTVVLECTVVVDRLVKCKVADDTVGSEEARGVALELVSFFRLQAENFSRKATKSHAIVNITYETGECPSWMCTITPAPVPIPPASTPPR